MSDLLSAAEPEAPVRHRRLITVSVMLASMMQVIDTTIANVALPRIQSSLSASHDQMTWVLTSYIIAAAIMTPLSGWLVGRLGRKRIYLLSVAGFTVASVMCAVSQTLPQIVLARLLQGLSGAALSPTAQAVLLDINPRSKHARAMALWATGLSMGPIIGPLLGGWITENFSWRWVFYINVPIGVLAFAGVTSFMTEMPRKQTRFDFFGFTSLSLAIGAFQLLLDRGQTQDWFDSAEIWTCAIIAGLGLYLFIVHILTTPRPASVSPALFKDRNFVIGNVLMFVFGAILYATWPCCRP
jgi:DHA2 family multidrug resistance protein